MVKFEFMKNALNHQLQQKPKQSINTLPEYQVKQPQKLESPQKLKFQQKHNHNLPIIAPLIVVMKLGKINVYVGVDIKRTMMDIALKIKFHQ